MSSLFSSLTSAARALDAQRFGLDVTGQNIANVNTPGYARRVIDMAAVPPESSRNATRPARLSLPSLAPCRVITTRKPSRRLMFPLWEPTSPERKASCPTSVKQRNCHL